MTHRAFMTSGTLVAPAPPRPSPPRQDEERTVPHAAGAPASGVQVSVLHECDVSAVIGATMRFCAAHRLNPVFAAHVATAASELANNLWMHARRGGVVQLSRVSRGDRCGVELCAEDDGPGIADTALALTEGYSTGGGMGCGLPGVQRLMDEFELESTMGRGTRVVARKWLAPRP